MNRITLILAAVLSLAFTQVTAQDFNKGLKAAQGGDYATALQEWKPLAEQGDAKAQFMLGLMYSKGHGVIKDYAEAVKWYRLSAEQGHDGAQHNLGVMYANGNGVLKDNVTAHMWLNNASANGNKKAGANRDKRATLMTPEDISKATVMARKCMASNYKKCGY